MKPARVFIVDDHPLMRNALEMAIDATSDMEIVGQAADGQEALRLIPLVEPDVILMDLMMPEIGGLDAIRALTFLQADPHILVLSSLEDEDTILQAVQMGALGYITKNAQRDELLRAIRKVSVGEAYMPPQIAAKLMRTVRSTQANESAAISTEALTARQKEVLALIGQGYSNKQIAATLHIAAATVRVHTSHIMDILGFAHRRELVVFAVKESMEGTKK